MRRTVLVLAIAVIAGLLGLPHRALACTCAQPSTVQEGLQRAHSVFAGLAERFELEGSRRMATFRVRRVWKGPESSRVQVATGGGDGDCGYHFIVGIEYIVFAHQSGRNRLETSICTRTKQASGEAVDDLKALGPGVPISERHNQ